MLGVGHALFAFWWDSFLHSFHFKHGCVHFQSISSLYVWNFCPYSKHGCTVHVQLV